MDISKWSIDERMRLPDWCFGNRNLVMAANTANGAGTIRWDISETTLPEKICIWQVGILPRNLDSVNSYIRFGFLSTKPTSEAEMDLAKPVLPNFGYTAYTPPRVIMPASGTEIWQFFLRMGVSTGKKKLAIELKCGLTQFSAIVFMLYSELPTNISGWLANSFITKVR